MVTPTDTGIGPLEVVVLSAFKHSPRHYYRKLKYRVNVLKMDIAKAVSNFAFGCTGLSEVYTTGDEYVFSKQNILTGEYEVPEQTLPCTKKMACGLAEAHRLISLCKDPNPNGIIILVSDGEKRQGDFFDGVEDFKSTWPVHTFSLNNITNEYEGRLRAIAENSPGGKFLPLRFPDDDSLDDILGAMKDDEKPPTRDADSDARIGLVTMKKLIYNKNEVALTTMDSLTVGVELNAAFPAMVREGLDLVVAVNIDSGVEGGDIRLSKMKKAMEYVITKLTPMDRLSIVSAVRNTDHFSRRSRRCPLRCMTPAGQTDLKAVINNMLSIKLGNTEALREAMAVIRGRRHTEGRTANILILSDNSRYERNLDPGNMVVHTFGLGMNINHQLLHDLAKRSPGGTYNFVPDSSDLCTPFSQLLGGLLTTVAQDVQLTLTSKGKHVDTMEVSSPMVDYYKHTSNINSRGEKEITFNFGTIFSGESRKVSVNFKLNPSKNRKGFNATIAEVQYSYNAQQGLEIQPPRSILIRRVQMPPSVVVANLHADDVRRHCIDSIRVAVFELANFGVFEEAQYQLRKLEEAQYKLQDGLNALEDIMLDDDGDKMVGVLRGDMLRLIKLMESMELYVELALPYAFAILSSHGLRRVNAKGDADPALCLYVTPRMITNLKQAKQFEKDPRTRLPSADDDLMAEIAGHPI